MSGKIILAPGREKSVLRHHLWIYSGALRKIEGSPQAGDVVEVVSSDGKFLARGGYSPASQIPVRIWTFDPEELVDHACFKRKIQAAAAMRAAQGLLNPQGGCRVVAAEGDAIPGLIADRYGDFLCIQIVAAAMEPWRDTVTELLVEALAPYVKIKGVYERSDLKVRAKEQLPERTGLLWGSLPPAEVEIVENNCIYGVDLLSGHKTGFYFDQRENRRIVAEQAKGKRVLNLFSYTGGFGVAAAQCGATEVLNIDSSEAALQMSKRNFERNGLSLQTNQHLEGDVFSLLRKLRGDRNARYDVIVLDPPKLIESQRAMKRGCRAYKDAALQCFHLLKPGGRLFTFSCSGLMESDLFQKITFDAASDANIEAVIERKLMQAMDHPIALNHPETFYLKGLQVFRRTEPLTQ